MTLSLNFRSDLIPEGRSAINGLERTLGDFLLLSSPCSRFAPDCSWACKERMPKGAHQSDHFREGGIGLRGAAAKSALRGGRASGTGRGQGPMSVADNLGSHKGDAVRNAIRDVGACLVFLPKILPTQPHRAGLRQVQNSAPKGASANYEGSPTPAAKFRPPCASYLKKAGTRRAKSRIL
jgi:hypothetical protein